MGGGATFLWELDLSRCGKDGDTGLRPSGQAFGATFPSSASKALTCLCLVPN